MHFLFCNKYNTIKDDGVRLLSKILGYKFNHGSRLAQFPARFLHAAYVMVMKGEKVNLCDIIQMHLLDNIAKLRYFSNLLSTFSVMETQEVFNISDKPRYTFKKHPFISLLDDPIRAFFENAAKCSSCQGHKKLYSL